MRDESFELVLIDVNVLFECVNSDLDLAWAFLGACARLLQPASRLGQTIRSRPDHCCSTDTRFPQIKTTLKATHSQAKCFASCRARCDSPRSHKCPKPLGVLNGSDRTSNDRKNQEGACIDRCRLLFFDPFPSIYNESTGRSRPTTLTIRSYTSQYPDRLDAPSRKAPSGVRKAHPGSEREHDDAAAGDPPAHHNGRRHDAGRAPAGRAGAPGLGVRPLAATGRGRARSRCVVGRCFDQFGKEGRIVEPRAE